MTKMQVGEERVYLAYIPMSQFIIEGNQLRILLLGDSSLYQVDTQNQLVQPPNQVQIFEVLLFQPLIELF